MEKKYQLEDDQENIVELDQMLLGKWVVEQMMDYLEDEQEVMDEDKLLPDEILDQLDENQMLDWMEMESMKIKLME